MGLCCPSTFPQRHGLWQVCYSTKNVQIGGAMLSWLVHLSPDRVVNVWALVRDIMFKPWPFSWEDTLLSQCLSPTRCINGYLQTYWWGQPCDGLGSHPGGVEILLVASCYSNRDKTRLDICIYIYMYRPLGLSTDLPRTVQNNYGLVRHC